MADLYFPLNSGLASWGTSVTQQWQITESKSASGRRRTLCQQLYPSWEFSLSFPKLTKQERDILLGFYSSCQGKFKSFFYKDFTDYRVEGQVLNQGADGLYRFVIPFQGYVEPCERVDNVTIYVDGQRVTEYEIIGGKVEVYLTGEGEHTVTADYDYYWRMSFGNSISFTEIFKNLYKVSLKLEVVRE